MDYFWDGFDMSAIQQMIFGAGSGSSPQKLFDIPGTYPWVCPDGVTSISVVCIGAGGGSTGNAASKIPDGNVGYSRGSGGGGGGLRYVNNMTVTPGVSYTVVVGAPGISTTNFYTDAGDGGDSSFYNPGTGLTLVANGGKGGLTSSTDALGGGSSGPGTGFSGGYSAYSANGVAPSGGGGAAGYSGDGGNSASDSRDGSGGGGGGGGLGGNAFTGENHIYTSAGLGGGTSVYGQGSSGSGGTNGYANLGISYANGTDGGPGSGGTGVTFGGGAGGMRGMDAPAGGGAVRIIWPGNLRQFPSTRTADE